MTKHLKLFLISLSPALALSGQAGEFEWSEIGLRTGIDAESSIDVQSYELITRVESPWAWSISDHTEIELDFECGLGALEGEGETGFLAHAGPAIEIEFGELPLEFILSSGPAYLSEHEFDDFDLGGSFQFMSAAGFDLEVADDWTVGYRYLHVSNAGLQDRNPGMNFHAVSLFYEF